MKRACMGVALLIGCLGSSPASACRAWLGNPAYEPTMAEFVGLYPEIYLARAVSAARAPVDEQPFPDLEPLYDYQFDIVEVLRGPDQNRIVQRGATPFSNPPSVSCLEQGQSLDSRACNVEVTNMTRRNWAHQLADAGHRDWPSFHSMSPYAQAGMGAAEAVPAEGAEDLILISCGGKTPSFEIGETFLIMRGNPDAFDERFGLNYQLITRDDDLWLEGVRYLVENPDAGFLQEIPVSSILAAFGTPEVVTFATCEHDPDEVLYDEVYMAGFSGMRPVARLSYLEDDTIVTFHQRDEFASEALTHCQSGGAFVLFPEALGFQRDNETYALMPPFPVLDGVVDFSHLPSQWSIAGPSQIPLQDVLSWPARDTEEAAGAP